MRSTSWFGRPHQVAAAERAALRVQAEVPGEFYAALTGFPGPVQPVQFCHSFEIRPVVEPPEPLNTLLNFCQSELDYSGSIPFHAITHELVIRDEWGEDVDRAARAASVVARMLRLRTDVRFSIPAVIDCPWDTVAGRQEGSVNVRRVDPEPLYPALKVDSGAQFSPSDIEWLDRSLNNFLNLWSTDERYRFALNCLNLADFDRDSRMGAVRLWGGIESIADVSQEISFRLSLNVSVLTHPPGSERITAYRNLKRLYSGRSKIVHGQSVKPQVLDEHFLQTRSILRDCLIRLTELGHVPDAREFEDMILSCEAHD